MNLPGRELSLRDAKTGPRAVPLAPAAVRVLAACLGRGEASGSYRGASPALTCASWVTRGACFGLERVCRMCVARPAPQCGVPGAGARGGVADDRQAAGPPGGSKARCATRTWRDPPCTRLPSGSRTASRKTSCSTATAGMTLRPARARPRVRTGRRTVAFEPGNANCRCARFAHAPRLHTMGVCNAMAYNLTVPKQAYR